MDITFSCPNCEQELEVDSEAAGTELECPTCNNMVTVPSSESTQATETTQPTQSTPHPPIAESAAAKEEKHFKVPHTESKKESELIAKPHKPLEAAAQEDERKLRIKCFKHAECVEIGKDQFEKIVSEFLDKVGHENIVSINTINYSTQDFTTDRLINDFGLLIVYKTGTEKAESSA